MKTLKDTIALTAFEIINKEGIDELKLERLARDLKISGQRLSLEFSSKKDVIEYLLDLRLQELKIQLLEIATSTEETNINILHDVFNTLLLEFDESDFISANSFLQYYPLIYRKYYTFVQAELNPLLLSILDNAKHMGDVRESVDNILFIDMLFKSIRNIAVGDIESSQNSNKNEIQKEVIDNSIRGILTVQGLEKYEGCFVR